MEIEIHNHQNSLEITTESTRDVVSSVLDNESIYSDFVSVHFVDTLTLSNLHADYFDDPSPTDCITFPVDAPGDKSSYHVLGELFVCPETALTYSKEHNKDPYEEATLYVVHGLLHLLGYDDIEEEECKKMRSAETRLMDLLKTKNVALRATEPL